MAKKRKRATTRRRSTKRRSTGNPKVYDSAGKFFGKIKRSSAKIVARAIGGTVGKPKAAKKNPIPRTRAVRVYAKRVGKRIEIRRRPF